MYNIFYIYTYKYIKPSNKLTLSRSLNAHISQHRINSLISYTHSQEQTASHLYRAKCTNRIMPPSHIAERSEHMWRF